MREQIKHLLERTNQLIDRLEQQFPLPPLVDFAAAPAFRWRRQQQGYFQAIQHLHHIRLEDLQYIETQRMRLDQNTRQFLYHKPANNALLWGARGTGKSSLVKALLNAYWREGLRLVEVEKQDLIDLPDIAATLYARPERFILFCDDLSFEQDDASYKALKSVLDGSISATPDNVLIYATSNRRHLLPEYMHENLEARHIGDEIHQGEAVEEKISLSERFGLWLSFYPFRQEEYLTIVRHWLHIFGLHDADDDEAMRTAALQWALLRGSRSGRAARQFAQDWAGQQALRAD